MRYNMEIYNRTVEALHLLYEQEITPGEVQELIDELIEEVRDSRPILTPKEEREFKESLDKISMDDIELEFEEFDFNIDDDFFRGLSDDER